MKAREFPLRARHAIAVSLGAGYVAWLLSGVRQLGYARDEGFYFQAARSYESWFELLFRSPTAALAPAVVDRYWAANHEHPSFMKSLFALCHHFLWQVWPLFSEQGTAYRFAGMLVSAFGVAVTYLWGERALGRSAGLVAALSLACMPRVFYHSHLACFDMPVAALWLWTCYAYQRSLTGSLGWVLTTGVSYGILLDTKHNSWLLPAVFVLHWLFTEGAARRRELRAGYVSVPLAWYAMLALSPLVFYLSWPWIWHDTARRLLEYVAFHTGHEYYNMEFLGRTYWEPPMPRGYAWLMTLGTVPSVTLLLFALGVLGSIARRSPRLGARLGEQSLPPLHRDPRFSTDVLWALGLLVAYAPWLSSQTPIFGGTKHWMTAYPFLCLFAGRGFALVQAALAGCFADGASARRLVAPALGLSVLGGPFWMSQHSHPWGLSFYTPLVGGAPGAASLGLNRTFWGYTTGALQNYIDAHAPPHATVYVHDTALQSWEMLRADGRVRADLRGSLSIPDSDLALYHHEPHMARVEYQIWMDYGTARPAAIGSYDGVPVVWLYARPAR